MKNIETLCDRCGKRIVNPLECYNHNYALKESSAKLTLWKVGEYRGNPGQRIDLCADCYEAFVGFLEGGCGNDE